jgi:MFS family permease
MTGGDIVQQVGIHFLVVTTSTFTYDMTRSAWAYALQQVLIFLPWMLFSGVAGPIVDRLDRRRVMIVSSLTRSLVILGFPLCRRLEGILALSFLSSACAVFLVTARTALIPHLCDESHLLQVNGVRTAVFGCVDMSAPALAGALLRRIGTTIGFRVASMAVLAGSMWFVAIPAKSGRPESQEITPGRARTERHGFLRDLGEALGFVKSEQALLGTILLYTVYSAGQSGANAVFYPFVESVLHAGPAVFGLAVSFYYGANFLAGILLARFGRAVKRLPTTMMIVPAALVWLTYCTVRSVPVIVALGFVEGTVMSVLSTLLMTDVQTRASAMTGRVWGVTMSASGGAEVAGILLAGTVAERCGPPVAYGVMGVLVLSSALATEIGRRRAAWRRTSLVDQR